MIGVDGHAYLDFSFNRTSLELKHPKLFFENGYRVTFNRTSLELKPLLRGIINTEGGYLLIEPVWN